MEYYCIEVIIKQRLNILAQYLACSSDANIKYVSDQNDRNVCKWLKHFKFNIVQVLTGFEY